MTKHEALRTLYKLYRKSVKESAYTKVLVVLVLGALLALFFFVGDKAVTVCDNLFPVSVAVMCVMTALVFKVRITLWWCIRALIANGECGKLPARLVVAHLLTELHVAEQVQTGDVIVIIVVSTVLLLPLLELLGVSRFPLFVEIIIDIIKIVSKYYLSGGQGTAMLIFLTCLKYIAVLIKKIHLDALTIVTDKRWVITKVLVSETLTAKEILGKIFGNSTEPFSMEQVGEWTANAVDGFEQTQELNALFMTFYGPVSYFRIQAYLMAVGILGTAVFFMYTRYTTNGMLFLYCFCTAVYVTSKVMEFRRIKAEQGGDDGTSVWHTMIMGPKLIKAYEYSTSFTEITTSPVVRIVQGVLITLVFAGEVVTTGATIARWFSRWFSESNSNE